MAKPVKPNVPYDTLQKRIERLEYLVYSMCDTFKINYDLD
jgi:hypothetical protein